LEAPAARNAEAWRGSAGGFGRGKAGWMPEAELLPRLLRARTSDAVCLSVNVTEIVTCPSTGHSP